MTIIVIESTDCFHHGEFQINPNWTTLSCYLTDNAHPLLRLRPLRVEEVKKNPDVLIFHDFITDFEIAQTKILTKSQVTNTMLLHIFVAYLHASA